MIKNSREASMSPLVIKPGFFTIIRDQDTKWSVGNLPAYQSVHDLQGIIHSRSVLDIPSESLISRRYSTIYLEVDI
jgi:hypothetical protein